MTAKLIIGGKEFEIEILDPELQKAITANKKTGYEIAELGETYYYDNGFNAILSDVKTNVYEDDLLRAIANCYSSSDIAHNNARADKLMRQLRRFAVENRKNNINWDDEDQAKYIITYRHRSNTLFPEDVYSTQEFGAIYFDSAEAACFAIDTFHDDLIWYFTEYKDSL